MILVLISLPGYTQALRPGVKASFGLAIDTQKLNDVAPTGPAHKVSCYVTNNSLFRLLLSQVGASFTFEA